MDSIPLLQRLDAGLGQGLLTLVQSLQRRRLGVREHRFVDARGRVTPWLSVGEPDRPTLVWLHGFADRPDTFLRTAPWLADRYRLVIPAMPGFADGWRDPGEVYRLAAYGDWLAEVLTGVVPGDFHLVGNSLGGATALAVAERIPERVASIVALSSAGMRVDGAPSVLEEVEAGDNLFEIRTREAHARLLERLFARPLQIPRPVDTFLWLEHARRADWHGRLGRELAASPPVVEGSGWASAVSLSRLHMPVLVLWGEQDRLFPVEHARAMAAQLPRGRLQLLPGVGHCAHLEAPRELARAIRAFLEGESSSSGPASP